MSYSHSIFQGENLTLSYFENLHESLQVQEEIQKYNKLQEMMEDKLFETYFQPIMDLHTEKTIGYEVFNRPPKLKLFPNVEFFYDFVSKLNQHYLIDQFTHFLTLERSTSLFIKKKNSLIFLNTFPRTLMNYLENLDQFLGLLDTYKISSNNIVFEISERLKIDDYDRMKKALERLRENGFYFALDDIGSGYNNLDAILSLNPDFMKIDKSIIHYIDQDKARQWLLSELLQYSKHMNSKLVAEGIERVEEYVFLQNKGVKIGQGYAIGKPSKTLNVGKLPR